jgi:preprotein translocase subunit YajC
MNAIALLQSTGGATAAIVNFAPFILLFVVWYFLVIRPGNEQKKKQREMLSALKKGDRVITSSGIYGTIASVEPEAAYLYLKIAENVKVKVARSAISGVEAGESES